MGPRESYISNIPEVNEVYETYDSSFRNFSSKLPNSSSSNSKTIKHLIYQLFQSFQLYKHYSWAQQIRPLFTTHFFKSFEKLWIHDTEKFYRLITTGEVLKKRNQNYQTYFYRRAKTKKKESSFIDTQKRLTALSSSIIDEKDEVPILYAHMKTGQKGSKTKFKIEMSEFNNTESLMTENNDIDKRYKSMGNEEMDHYEEYNEDPLFLRKFQSQIQKNSQKYKNMTHEEIERSSIIIPETVFVNRMQEAEQTEVLEMLEFYKIFSSSLQQLIKSVSLISCPIKHFEASLKKKLKEKKILKEGLKNSIINSNSSKAYIKRKKHEYNNNLILVQLRDFMDAYTEFIWKYLGLYEIEETQYKQYITIQAVYGIVFKIVWQFVSWIGNRGYQYEQLQLPKQIKKIQSKNKSEKVIPEHILEMGCALKQQTCPQKYLKKVVLIYREMSKSCESADNLITDYEILLHTIVKKRCSDRMFRMHNIINKVLKVDQKNGEIGYAWTTWSIMVEFLKNQINKDDRDIAKEKGFEYIS